MFTVNSLDFRIELINKELMGKLDKLSRIVLFEVCIGRRRWLLPFLPGQCGSPREAAAPSLFLPHWKSLQLWHCHLHPLVALNGSDY